MSPGQSWGACSIKQAIFNVNYMTIEKQIEEFLKKGGKIKNIPPRDDRFHKNTSRFHYSERGPTLIEIDNAFRTSATQKKRRYGIGNPFKRKHYSKKAFVK
jgi:hypothetical protein